jgi:hypothetical protein
VPAFGIVEAIDVIEHIRSGFIACRFFIRVLADLYPAATEAGRLSRDAGLLLSSLAFEVMTTKLLSKSFASSKVFGGLRLIASFMTLM